MNRYEVEKLIDQSSSFEDFICNQHGKLEFQIEGIPIGIYKEEVGVRIYYQLPYDANYDYMVVCDFMKYAIPFLTSLIEKKKIG